jgi:hypothetical protein
LIVIDNDIYTYQPSISQEYLRHPLLRQILRFPQPLPLIPSLFLPSQLPATLFPPIFVSSVRSGHCYWLLASFATLLMTAWLAL